MHVGINAHLLSRSQSYRAAGISRHIGNLIDNLGGVDCAHRYTIFIGPDGKPTNGTVDNRIVYATSRIHTESPPARILWEQIIAPFEVRRLNIDVFHAPAYVTPLATGCPTVVTVHDLSFERLPHLFNRGNRLYLSSMTRASVQRARGIIAVSESTRRELIELLGVPERLIHVIPNGVEPFFQPLDKERIDRFRAERGLPERFILFLGTLEPRKNVRTLLRAYARLRRDHGTDHSLVLAGAKGWLYESIFEEARSLGLENAVLFPGFVPFEDQPLWYNACTVFAFPSLYEGFGMPALEAMACGAPVVCSNTTSLPEVVGDAGLTIPPLDEAALADALWRVLDQPAQAARMRSAGLEQAKRFSWASIARATVAVYDAAA